MKIKTKKEMNLPELIEWGFENNIRNESYITSDDEGYELYFDLSGTPRYSNFITKYDAFTVEIEEPITEDTEIKGLVELSSRGLLGKTTLYRYHSINDVIDNQSVAFYILNDNQTMVLIWRDGRLIEWQISLNGMLKI